MICLRCATKVDRLYRTLAGPRCLVCLPWTRYKQWGTLRSGSILEEETTWDRDEEKRERLERYDARMED